MTTQQLSTLMMMRDSGAGYLKIAQVLGVSKDTVKKYCQRHDLKNITGAKVSLCPICGSKLVFVTGKKAKRFCSDRCRYIWHNKHRAQGGLNASL